jgi:hypothetical protein
MAPGASLLKDLGPTWLSSRAMEPIASNRSSAYLAHILDINASSFAFT